ncbi:Gustatory receptor 148 [Halyomorpha halys]|nr:Gustatory receptor 148 [Halyomorpha halys]
MECKWFRNIHEKYHKYFSSHEIPWTNFLMLILKLLIAPMHLMLGYFRNELHSLNLHKQVNVFFKFAYEIDNPTCFIPAISSLCLLIKRQKYSKMVEDINRISESLGTHFTSSYSRRLHYLFATALLLIMIYEFRHEWYIVVNTPSVYSYYFLTYLKWLVVWDFAKKFAVIRFYYKQLWRRLDLQCVEKLIKYHQILDSCCTTLWECYTIQLTIFIIYIFTLFVSNAYLIIDSYSRRRILDTYHYMFGFWAALYTSYSWLIVSSCAGTKNMARKFDKKLIGMILNDGTNKLIRSKRIILHLKAKSKVFPSVMGFFDYDYPLLLSMASSATTYIVILFQFSR